MRTVHLCADDLVFLVPLDALPLDEGVVGDRITVVNEVSCARLLDGAAPEPAGPGLLLVGGVDYDAGATRMDERIAHAEVDLRSGTAGFAPLPETRAEVGTLLEQFEQRFDTEPLLLDGAQATKQRFADAVAGKRWIHVATHGWFAPETLRSQLDGHDDFADAQPSEEADAAGMAPMLLCGLALAGANGSRDALGRMDGLMTAEELSTLDLRDCELAVLSACETNVGVRRAGQGIQSLQAALYAAGARSSITSLWKVDDEATRRLFEAFYRYLWEDGLTKSAALEEARRDLRRAGAPARDWAAWVLTGAPE